MLELALKGNRTYWIWMAGLLAVMGAGAFYYADQLKYGLMVTGQSRDVSWGFYTAQMTYFVGVAAGGVMLVLPYYLHNYKKFGKITILGEFLAVASIVMCLLYLLVHLGQPMRALNIFLYPTPGSMLFWDGNVLFGYLVLNIIIGWNVLEAERNGSSPPVWIKPLIYLSIPMAFSIHTVTAFIYCGLPGRGFWLTAVLAPRFLASAFAAGPAILILLCMFVRKMTQFDPGKEAIHTLALIVAYGLIANVFFLFCEVFVVFYSGIPSHMDHIKYLYVGLHGHSVLVPWMWTSVFCMGLAIVLLVIPRTRKNSVILFFSCILVFVGTWIDKGLGMIAGGFVPSALHHVTEYVPTMHELIISAGVTAIGVFILTVLFKITISIKVYNQSEKI
ncbi:sulfate reduction electron transfer complex DsrMKJOP subunit DsrP [Desulfobacula phenolica]|uniref:Putative sulfite reductase-associated electron transfer protein DsrP n=1 Tax=Desulfobacula phenolica TaxID=90732 RepID=A0A1H2FD27_9BACT|nr:NrfD/PsrC family molybdoenzyme membrane anchor subunit [Desulfobacula phenolica]SDU04878.1 putative sulfite reductase-associated electron transfer protein DsrP [Desulfobacula phenolica]